MKIAHVVDSMEVGGAETLVSQMCRLQRQEGHEPRVYALTRLGVLGERMRADGFMVTSNVGRHLPDSSLAFARIFRSLRPDVVHLHNPTPTIYAAPAARLTGVPSVISTRHSLVAPPRNVTMERKYKVAAMFCDWIVGICDATVRNIREAGSAHERKIVRIYNGTVPIVPPPQEQRREKRGLTLLYVGRLEAVKNLPLLLSGFLRAKSHLPGMQLWIVGDGTERRRLEKIVDDLGLQSSVTFWGQQLDVTPFFASADAFVMSSLSEGLPMSLLQALSISLPAIVTDVGGMAEVVRLGEAGMIVCRNDEAAMGDAIMQMATEHNVRAAFAKNAARTFESYFTLPVMVQEYMELYRNTPRMRRRGA